VADNRKKDRKGTIKQILNEMQGEKNCKVESSSSYLKQGGLIAPNGKKSNLTPEQYKLVRTTAFKKWFGDWENDPENSSKVVDENGEPLVLFNGTDVNFNVYDLNKTGEGSDLLGKGIYLTENKEIANFYANLVAKKRYIKGYEQGIFGTETPLYEKDADKKAEKHKVIYDFFVNAKNIVYLNEININNDIKEILTESISYMFGDKSEDIINSRIDFVDKNNNKIKNYRGKIIYLIEQFPDAKKGVLEYIKNKYDCIVFDPTNEFEGAISNYKNYVVFEPNQIKLADGRNNTFDKNNDDIRYDKGGKIEVNQSEDRGDLYYFIDGKKVAYAKYQFDLESSLSDNLSKYKSELYLEMVEVDEDFRNKGIAKKLLKKLISIAENLKVEVVSLRRESGLGCDYGSDYDNYLKGIYESLGFVEFDEENCAMKLVLKNKHDIGGNIKTQNNDMENKSDNKEMIIEQTAEIKTNIESYKNPYEINKAIEKLLDQKGDSDNYSNDELEFISYYSGYGGLEKFGKVGNERLKTLIYEFYTPDAVVKKMWALAYKYGYGTIADNSVFEPSVGIGAFLKYAPKDVKLVANEINEYSVKICELLYPNAKVELKYFEQNFLKSNLSIKSRTENLEKYSLVIGNPPYGRLDSKYTAMGDDSFTKAGNFTEYFITRGLDLLVQGGLLIYIVGAEQYNGGSLFLDSPLSKVKEIIFDKADLLDAYRLPINIFERTGVSSEIVVFKKR
jgi:ribosomal protein S18 acetylase RimI-like enzyme